MTWPSWWPSRRPLGHRPDPPSPYKNTRPGVEYVGDAACARCHVEIAEAFRGHPMGRSLAPIDASRDGGGDDWGHGPAFKAQGFEYSVERREGGVFHIEARRDTRGRIIAQNEAEVRFALGSGRQGVAFLIERDGFLSESPITWYVRERRWDLSPGYEVKNVHFDRPIQPDCLFCHANRVEPVEGTINRYQRPVFRGHAIGCERCHGPGALHVARPEAVAGEAAAIVNPGDLEAPLREAVCEQCHLLGERRVLRAGRRSEDYRPGLPFHRFWSVFVRPESSGGGRFVGQVEQMHVSRCFRESRGRLGCISCHDPHRLPPSDERVAYYRDRCLDCHAERGCSLPAAIRLARSRDDDCTVCHMPRRGGFNNPHVATADHRIPRRADATGQPPSAAAGVRGGARRLVLFHQGLMDARERTAAERDLGLALIHEGPEGAEVALPLLEAAVAARPDDLDCREAAGLALGQLSRAEEGLAALRAVLAAVPARESALARSAALAAQAGRREEAIGYWRRAIDVNPWLAYYRTELALQYALGQDWRLATDACRKALELDPANVAVRKLLIEASCRLRDFQAARVEFETLMGFDPPDRDILVRWFARQSEAGGMPEPPSRPPP
jgi:hypothetical protein